ncbi:MAG: thioredoxin family protein [Lachnospiraceae bacterium]|nr:thioredoxin family protein [Lachnospiraceae bacterium]
MELKKVTGDNFQTEVTEAGMPVLLDFYADWCGPCKAQHPILMEAAEEACDVKFCEVNVDEEPRLAERFGVRQVPTMLIMNGEKVFGTMTGLQSLESVLQHLEM